MSAIMYVGRWRGGGGGGWGARERREVARVWIERKVVELTEK